MDAVGTIDASPTKIRIRKTMRKTTSRQRVDRRTIGRRKNDAEDVASASLSGAMGGSNI
jgi:hypothetical protein